MVIPAAAGAISAVVKFSCVIYGNSAPGSVTLIQCWCSLAQEIKDSHEDLDCVFVLYSVLEILARCITVSK